MRRDAAIIGTGYSAIARHGSRPLGALALEALTAAAAEAGVKVEDIDGLCAFTSPARIGGPTPIDGIDVVTGPYLTSLLPLRKLRWSCSIAPGSFLGAVVEARNAIAAGQCDIVAVWRAMHNPPGRYGRFTASSGAGIDQFTAPYGLSDNITAIALPYSRYMALYGAARRDMATVVVNSRKNAASNADAVFYRRPVTEEEYLDSRMISEPLSLLDCDMPVDGCGVVLVGAMSTSGGGNFESVRIKAGSATLTRQASTVRYDLSVLQEGARLVGENLWQEAGLGPQDVNVVNVYDGFSFFIYLWLEGLGFCGEGEAPAFVQGGRIDVTGPLPLNTSGGSLGMGRLHGPPQVIESVRQLQGRCGERQVERPEVAVATNGNPGKAPAAMVLSVR